MARKILDLSLSSSFERVHEKAHTNKDFVAVSMFSQVTKRGDIEKTCRCQNRCLLSLCFASLFSSPVVGFGTGSGSGQ